MSVPVERIKKLDYRIEEDHAVLYLDSNTGSHEVLLDIPDLDTVLNYPCSWFVKHFNTGYSYAYGKTYARMGRKMILMHRFLMGFPDGLVVDHINHNTIDNRRSNLQVVTLSDNSHNERSARKNNKSSGCLNVTFNKSLGLWRVNFNAKHFKHTKHFKDFEEAKAHAKEVRKKMYKNSYENLLQKVVNEHVREP